MERKNDKADRETLVADFGDEGIFQAALRRAVIWPIIASLCALGLLLGLLSYLFSAAREADRSNEILAQISRVEKLAVDMETGVRGYRITADPAFLEPFQRATAVFAQQLDQLEGLTRDDPFQVRKVQDLRGAHAAWTGFATNTRDRVQAQLPADVAAHLRGKELMDEVRSHIAAMQNHERQLLARHSATRASLRQLTIAAVVLAALAIAPAVMLSARRALRRVTKDYRTALSAADQERERLRITLSSIGDAVIATDEKGRITYLNPVAVELTGWTIAEANGQPLTDVFKIINEQTRQPVQNPVQAVLQHGRVVGLANHTLLVAKDGQETPIADSAAPIKNSSGSITGVVLVFRDQTAERQAAAKLEWLASFPDKNPNPVLEVDPQSGEMVYTNSFANAAYPDLKEKGLQHPFLHQLKDAAEPALKGNVEFVRREISLGEKSYAQTISWLPEQKRLRIYCSDITATKKVETALRESRDQIRLISDGVPALISYVDNDLRYQFCNRAYTDWFGVTCDEIVGQRMPDFLGEKAWKTIGPNVEQALAGRYVEYEALAPYRNQARWIHAVYTPHHGADGRVIGIVIMVTDVTQRKRAELLLDSQKHSLELLVNDAPLCEVLTFMARVVEEQSSGEATASILLLDSEELLRNGASPSLPGDYLAAIDGLKPCEHVGTCCAAAATGKVILTPDIENDPKWASLKHLPLNLGFVAAWSHPITSSDGRVLGTFGTYFRQRREPTPFERQTVEILSRTAALAIERRLVVDERKRFVSLAENSSDFIGMCDAKFLPFFVNSAGLAMVGLDDMDHARRTPVREFFFPEDQDHIIKQFFPAVLAVGSGEIEIRFRHFKTGGALWMLYNVWVVNDDDGKFAGLATVSRNITDRKLSEDALRHSEAELARANEQLASRAKHLDRLVEERTAELRETIQQLETFSYSIVHDMRAPLRSMRSFAGFLHEDYAEKLDPNARDYLRRIVDSSARMDALITDVLNYSRVSRDSTTLFPVDLDQLIPEIIEHYPHLQEKRGSIRVQHPLPKVAGNKTLLTQVFSNLLDNALKFVPRDRPPQVSVRAETNHDTVRIFVEDNGIGVPSDQRDRIFGLFQRLHHPQEYAGTGVGLAIVKRATEKMGGRSGVDSDPGMGSRFWIDLRLPETAGGEQIERN